jgi:hypothetical protein
VIAPFRAAVEEGERVHQALVDRAKRGDAEAFDALARLVGDRCIACRVTVRGVGGRR